MSKEYEVFVINPGSTSTKIALFRGEHEVFSHNILHTAEELSTFDRIYDQLAYRRDRISVVLAENNISLENIDACIGRGGGLYRCVAGTYYVEEQMMNDCKNAVDGEHAANLGALLADYFATYNNALAFIADQPTADEFIPLARVCGWSHLQRFSRNHVLNEKEVARRAAKFLGKTYQECNFVVVHLGGGLSVAAHEKGKLIDSQDCLLGEGAFAATRSGTILAKDVVDMCFSGNYTKGEMIRKITQQGGLVDHLGTNDLLEVLQRVENGDEYAAFIYQAMIYQIAKQIGCYATVLRGQVDGIVVSGGMAHSDDLIHKLQEYVAYIAPVMVYAGEFEMEALRNGALRVLREEEAILHYRGKTMSDNLRDYM